MNDQIFKLDIEEEVTVLTLTLDNITMYQNEELKKAFADLLEKGEKNIILDLSRTNYISSIVIASLVFMVKRVKEAGGNLVMCSVKGNVKEVLAMTNLDKVFDIFEDRKKAAAQFKKK